MCGGRCSVCVRREAPKGEINNSQCRQHGGCQGRQVLPPSRSLAVVSLLTTPLPPAQTTCRNEQNDETNSGWEPAQGPPRLSVILLRPTGHTHGADKRSEYGGMLGGQRKGRGESWGSWRSYQACKILRGISPSLTWWLVNVGFVVTSRGLNNCCPVQSSPAQLPGRI